MKFIPLVLLSLSTLLFACSNESSINSEQTMQAVELSALQKEWQLVSIDNNIINAISYLNVDIQATATGNLACNSFFGTLELQQNKLRIDKMGSTRKMCEPKINTIEMMVSSTLSTWSKVKVDGQKLILTGHKHTLIYNLK